MFRKKITILLTLLIFIGFIYYTLFFSQISAIHKGLEDQESEAEHVKKQLESHIIGKQAIKNELENQAFLKNEEIKKLSSKLKYLQDTNEWLTKQLHKGKQYLEYTIIITYTSLQVLKLQ